MFRTELHGRFEPDTIYRLVRTFLYLPGNLFLSHLRDSNTEYSSWNYFVDRLAHDSAKLKNLQRLYLLRDLPDYLLQLDRIFTEMFTNVGYIAPTRATGERFYRIQELAVDQIDPRGENLAMFLNSLSPAERRRFTEWTEKYLGYSVFTRSHEGHVSIMLREEDAKSEFNLADVGYGLSQVLPVAAQMWALTRSSRRLTPITILARQLCT